jgi:hypothetical protein
MVVVVVVVVGGRAVESIGGEFLVSERQFFCVVATAAFRHTHTHTHTHTHGRASYSRDALVTCL